MADIAAVNPAVWPAVITLVGTMTVALIGFRSKRFETDATDQTTFRKELMSRVDHLEDRLSNEQKAHSDLRVDYIDKVTQLGKMQVAISALEARNIELTNTIDSLRRRPVGNNDSEPFDRRAMPTRPPLPSEITQATETIDDRA